MIYTEQVGTFSEAGNLFPSLLHASIALNLMLPGFGPGDAKIHLLLSLTVGL